MTTGGVAARRDARAPAAETPPVALRAGVVVVLLSGLALWPWADQVFPLPKAALAALGATLVLAVGVRRSALPRAVAALVAAGCAVLVLAALTGPDPVTSLVGRFPRYEGVAVVATYVLVLAAGARAGRWWPQLERTTTVALGVGVVAVTAVAVVEALGPSTGERIGSLLGNATDLGVWCALVALVLAPVALRGSRVAAVACVVAVGVTVWSASRGAISALVVGAVVLLVASWRDVRARRVLLAGAAAAAAVALLLPDVRGRLIGSDAVAAATGSGRWLLWSDTVSLLRAHLPLGVGPSGFVDAIGAAHGPRWAAEVGPLDPPDTPHSLPLQAAASGGLLLLGVVAALAVLVAVLGVRRVRADRTLVGVAAAVAGWAAASLSGFTTPGTTALACLLVGVLVHRSVEPGPWWAARLPALVGALVCVALLAGVAAETQVRRGIDLLGTGDLRGSASAWDRAAVLRPGDADLLLRRGHATLAASDAGLVPTPACLPSTAAALAALPTSSEAALDRARCLELNRQFAAALRVLDAAVEHDPVNVDLVLLQGVVAAEAGRGQLAVEHLLRAAELRPSAREPWADLAIVYRRLGRDDLAAEAQRRAGS